MLLDSQMNKRISKGNYRNYKKFAKTNSTHFTLHKSFHKSEGNLIQFLKQRKIEI